MKNKIGLVLGGGGAKGAYQVGVLKALKEYKILKKVKMISATSIGALNAMKILDNDLDSAINIWENMNKKIALTNSSLLTKIKTRSLFSRQGFIDLCNDRLDFDKISKSKIECYVIATPLTNKIKDAPCEFLVNEKDKDTILKYLLASSAIPGVFESVIIDGIKYMDGYGVSNVPVKTLKDKGCNIIFVVPLKDESDAFVYSDSDTLIIDFVSKDNNEGFIDGTLDFNKENSIKRMDNGYRVAKELINRLIKDKVIAFRWYQKINLFIRNKFKKREKDYYSIND